MTRFIHWLRSLLRIEMRHIIANPGRTLLVASLIAMPVAAIVGGGNLLFVADVTPAERVVREMGRADLKITSARKLSREEILRSLPAGSTVEELWLGHEQMRVPGLRLDITLVHANVDGLASGMISIINGRAPAAADEVALSSSLITSSGLTIGDSVELGDSIELGDVTQSNIVGILEKPEGLAAAIVLKVADVNASADEYSWLVSIPNPGSQPNANGDITIEDAAIETKEFIASQRNSDAAGIFLLGGFAMAEAALIVSAAFIAGIRRRQREIGLLASAGSTRWQVVMSILISAMLVSVVAGIIGVSTGLLGAWLIHPWLDSWNGRRNGIFEICYTRHLLAVLMGIVTAVLSATLPAIAASRMLIRTALSGRQPTPSSSGRWIAVGFVLVATGVGLTISASLAKPGDDIAMQKLLAGSVLGVLGFGACSPWFLQLFSYVAKYLPLSPKLAIRDAGRFRTRYGPIVTAILGGMALSITIATILQSITTVDGQLGKFLRSDQVLVEGPGAGQTADSISKEFATTGLARMEIATFEERILFAGTTRRGPQTGLQIAVGGADLIAAMGIDDSNGSTLRALERGELVALNPESPDKPVSVFTFADKTAVAQLQHFSPGNTQTIGDTGFIVSPQTSERLGWKTRRGFGQRAQPMWLVRLNEEVDSDNFRDVTAVAARLPGTSVEAQFNRNPDRRFYWIILLFSFLTGLAIVAIATALASAESKNDQRVLSTIGASPVIYRNQAAARAGFLTLLGCSLAVPAGLLPAYGLISMVGFLDFAIPWSDVAVIVVGLPILSCAFSWIMARPARNYARLVN